MLPQVTLSLLNNILLVFFSNVLLLVSYFLFLVNSANYLTCKVIASPTYTLTTLIRSANTPAAVTSAQAPYPLITIGSSLYLSVVRRIILLLTSRLNEG